MDPGRPRRSSLEATQFKSKAKQRIAKQSEAKQSKAMRSNAQQSNTKYNIKHISIQFTQYQQVLVHDAAVDQIGADAAVDPIGADAADEPIGSSGGQAGFFFKQEVL